MSSLNCTGHQACSSKAVFYCIQCSSLQCISCEKEIHQSSNTKQHERLNLDEIEDEYCAINRHHRAVFYCPTCTLSFCYSCYINKHQHSDGIGHKPQKYRNEQVATAEKDK